MKRKTHRELPELCHYNFAQPTYSAALNIQNCLSAKRVVIPSVIMLLHDLWAFGPIQENNYEVWTLGKVYNCKWKTLYEKSVLSTLHTSHLAQRSISWVLFKSCSGLCKWREQKQKKKKKKKNNVSSGLSKKYEVHTKQDCHQLLTYLPLDLSVMVLVDPNFCRHKIFINWIY